MVSESVEPPITHLFFASDSLLFSRASTQEGDIISQIFRDYEQASGQQIHLDKSELSFSRNVRKDIQKKMKNRMGVKAVEQDDKYLGLPTFFYREIKEAGI